ncbi:hypothetical protein BU23DRAFT_564577 [Bimuria novae-zelandiae CBS 107.79]|uniref:Mid2 domain-containing protein n=1 Tax=Bimuria novae-zelandiae CBS 107.79 TaxID=1447943 RepID=A0A6A5VKG6_9PLEO|nr:hypothetical protein BU23DRAFT_564577 [Bimuria novae-zelandiae CBS 107.79]
MAIPRVRTDRGYSLFSVLVLFSHLQFSLGASKKCFNESGDQTNQLPCAPDSPGHDICCEAGDICLSNGLCKYGPNAARNESIEVDTYRPDCTDQSWDNEKCFGGCNNFKELLVQTCYDNRYCCYGANGCDCSKTSLFELNAATFVTTLPLGSATATSVPARVSATTTSVSVNSSTANASPTQSSTGSSSSSSSHLGVAVGAGVGAGLAVVIIGSVATFLFMRRRKKRMMAEFAPAGGATYQKGYSVPLLEVDGRSAPQEIGYKGPPQELDGRVQMKVVPE